MSFKLFTTAPKQKSYLTNLLAIFHKYSRDKWRTICPSLGGVGGLLAWVVCGRRSNLRCVLAYVALLGWVAWVA